MRDAKEKIGRSEDELRHVKESLGYAMKRLHQRWTPSSNEAAAAGAASGVEGDREAAAGSTAMAKKFVDLTAKLREATETYSKVFGVTWTR